VVVLAQPVEEEHAAVLALPRRRPVVVELGLALALRTSQRSVQRALDALGAAGKVQRWEGPRASLDHAAHARIRDQLVTLGRMVRRIR
jgi:hypothetical protein